MNKFASLMIFIALVFSCNIETNETPSRKPKKLSMIDITNAKALMVVPQDLIARASSGGSVFVKEISSGSLEEVTIQDEDGATVNYMPTAIYNATDVYMIIVVDGIPYLVNKLNGSAYDLASAGIPEMLRANYGYNGNVRKSIYQDLSGNIYYISGGVVKKINVTNPLEILAEDLTPDVYSISSVNVFSVDKNGNVIYSYNDNFVEHWRIKTIGGSIISLDEKNPD
jgi:hypothetical protein